MVVHTTESSNRRNKCGNNADYIVQFCMAIIFLLYIFVCLSTFMKLPSASNHRRFHDDIKTSIIQVGDGATGFGVGDVNAAKNNNNKETTTTKKKKHYLQAHNNLLIDGDEIKKLQHTFPVHVGDDVERIVHPAYQDGMEVFNTVSKYLTVPKFWNPKAYGGDVREYLGEYGKRLMTPEEAKSIGSFHNEDKTIYLSIASYRDPECSLTLDSLFERAHKPERIRIAVIEQRVDGDPICVNPDKPCEEDQNQTRCKYRHLVDNFEMDARLGVGPVFARHLGYRYYRGEYFAGQLDAHVRFVEGWDVSIVEQFEQANNEMAVLTTYLSDLNGSIDPKTNKAIRPGRPIMCATDYEGKGAYKHLRHGQQPEGPAMIHGTPTLHPFWAAGFSFARGHFVVQVPYDQFLPMIFQGEEISLGLRGFTYGYDYYTPEKSVCFHMYALKDYKARRDKVPHFWENNAKFARSGIQSMKRLNGLIGMENPGDNDIYDKTDSEKYTLGSIRRKEKFFKVLGIHPETQTVEHNLCRFVGKPMQRLFIPTLRENGMGLDYDKINFEWKDPDANKKKKK